MPQAAAERAQEVVSQQWGEGLVRSWSDWYEMPERIGAKIAKLIGAQADEVIVADSTTVNLYKLVLAALQARKGRTDVVTDDLNFPSDIYAISSALSGGEWGEGRGESQNELRSAHS